MRTITGDLLRLALNGEFDVIIHGCNCQCVMGKGIALSIREQFPEAYDADRATVKGDRAKLGTISTAWVERDGQRFVIVNAYTQFHWRGPEGRADYDAIRGSMRAVKAAFSGMRIGYPKIGAGLAGGDWRRISVIIDKELEGEDHCYVEYAP